MKARQSAIVDTARHVLAFLDANASVIGSTVDSARQNLVDATAQLVSMASTQTGGVIASKGATARQRALRRTLRQNYMKPVTTVAKLVLPDVPEIGALAVSTKNMKTNQLVAAAQAMADASQNYATVLIAHGLPSDFVTNLRSAADAVTHSLSSRQSSVAATGGATSGMLAQEARVRNTIQLINLLIIPKLGTNATLLAQWKLARSISSKAAIPGVPSSVSDTITSSGAAPASSGGQSSTSSSTAAPAPAPASTPAAAPVPAAAPAPTPSATTTP